MPSLLPEFEVRELTVFETMEAASCVITGPVLGIYQGLVRKGTNIY